MAKIKQGKKDVDSYTIRGTTKVVRGTYHTLPSPPAAVSGEKSDAMSLDCKSATPC